jgi:hypothetical protein
LIHRQYYFCLGNSRISRLNIDENQEEGSVLLMVGERKDELGGPVYYVFTMSLEKMFQ